MKDELMLKQQTYKDISIFAEYILCSKYHNWIFVEWIDVI